MIRMRQGETVIQFRVRIERRGKVEPGSARFRPVRPAGKVFDGESVAVASGNHPVNLVPLKHDFTNAGDHGERLFQILSQFLRCPGASGVVACNLTSSGQCVTGVFKTGDIIALPCVESDYAGVQPPQSLFHINAVFRIDGTCVPEHPFRSVAHLFHPFQFILIALRNACIVPSGSSTLPGIPSGMRAENTTRSASRVQSMAILP